MHDTYLMEADGSGTIKAVFTCEPTHHGAFISQHRDNATSYFHYDATDSTRQVTDDSQALLTEYFLTAHGQDAGEPPSDITNPFRYKGGAGYYSLSDPAAGLVMTPPEAGDHYARGRIYSSETYRWESQDPLTFRPEVCNRFRFSDNNPINVTDPGGAVCGGDVGSGAFTARRRGPDCQAVNPEISTALRPRVPLSGGTQPDPVYPSGDIPGAPFPDPSRGCGNAGPTHGRRVMDPVLLLAPFSAIPNQFRPGR
jgi:RHS repeat-associated protein